MSKIKIGVIGGSGIYELKDVRILEEKQVHTPFGEPSDKIIIASVGGREVAFLPRHGLGHRFLPTEVNSSANIYALKSVGVERIIAISAAGSLKKEIRPTDFVIPSQIIDRTKSVRELSYFGKGIVGHISFADPFCNDLSSEIAEVIGTYFKENQPNKKLHTDETYLCMEGPQFSTRAESNLYRSWGACIIGMTAIPEAKLAREAEMCYSMIAMATDYDCWYEQHEDVDVNIVMEYMKENTKTINEVLPIIIESINLEPHCHCHEAAQHAILTSPESMPIETRRKLELFYGKYWK